MVSSRLYLQPQLHKRRDTNSQEKVNEWYAPSLCTDPIHFLPKPPYTPKQKVRRQQKAKKSIDSDLLEVALDFVMLIQDCWPVDLSSFLFGSFFVGV